MSDEPKACPGIPEDTRVHLPPLDQLFTCGLHPQYYDILRSHEDWVYRHLLPGEPKLAYNVLHDNLGALFVCMAYFEHDADKVKDICDLMTWLFIHDDDVVDLRTAPDGPNSVRQAAVDDYLGKIEDVLDGGVATDTRWAMESIHDLIERFTARSSPKLLARLLDALGFYSTVATSSEVTDLLDHRITDLAEHMELRSTGGSSASQLFHVVTEYIHGVDLDPEVVAMESVDQYWRAIMDCWYLPNDLLSFRTECTRGDHNNAVCVLRRSEGLSLQEAVDRLACLINERQADAARRYAEISESPLASIPGLLACLENLQHVAAANQRWSYMVPRYHGEGFVWNGVLTGELRLTRSHTYFPDVPATRVTEHGFISG